MTELFDRKKRAKSAQLTVRLDEQLKKRAELRLEVMGMTATDAVEQLYRFIAEHGRMPLQAQVVTSDDFTGSKVTSFSLDSIRGNKQEDNVLRMPPNAGKTADFYDVLHAAFKNDETHRALLDNTNVQIKYAEGDATGRLFSRGFLAFLAGSGVSCSDSRLFVEQVGLHAKKEDKCRSIVAVMQNKHLGVNFVFHNETLLELPRFASLFPAALIAELGFTADQARAVLKQIQMARTI